MVLRELRSEGYQIVAYSCDVADAGKLTDVFHRGRREIPLIRSLIQAAMVSMVVFSFFFFNTRLGWLTRIFGVPSFKP